MPPLPANKPFAHYLAMLGCISTGIVYLGIGVVALLSFYQLKEGGADESSLMVYLNRYFAGKLLIGLILSGMVSYIIWRFYETIKDPYDYGKDLRGRLRRTVILLSSLADGLIAYSALVVLLGTGGYNASGLPKQERKMAAEILELSWGATALTAIGILIIITGIMQTGYVISNTYRERIDIYHLKTFTRKIIVGLAWTGHFARGIILSIIGYHYILAGTRHEADRVVNTDKAFDFIGDHAGSALFIAVAIATCCYGIFMFIMGWNYDSDKH